MFTCPQEAVIYIDGAEKGRTPLTIEVDAGEHTLGAMLPGDPATLTEQIVPLKPGARYEIGLEF